MNAKWGKPVWQGRGSGILHRNRGIGMHSIAIWKRPAQRLALCPFGILVGGMEERRFAGTIYRGRVRAVVLEFLYTLFIIFHTRP